MSIRTATLIVVDIKFVISFPLGEFILTGWHFASSQNRTGGVIVIVRVLMITSLVMDRLFEARSGQTKDYKIGIKRLVDWESG